MQPGSGAEILGNVQIVAEKGGKVGYNSVTFEDVEKFDVPKINQAVMEDGEQYTSTLAYYLVE